MDNCNDPNDKKNMFYIIEEWILVLSVGVMAVILIGNVISRTIVGKSWYFAEEVGQSLTVLITFFGLGYAARKNKHVNMSAILDIVSDDKRIVLEKIISIFTSVFSFYMAYISLQYVLKVKELQRVSPALRIPSYIIIACVPMGFCLSGISYIKDLIINKNKKDMYKSNLEEKVCSHK